DGTVRLPFDVGTGRLLPEVWERWLAWDPVRMASGHAGALRSMCAIHLDAGTRDEHHLDLAAEAFRRELEAVGVAGVRFLQHDGGHVGNQHRYVLALRYLSERLSRER
ncbi:MAG TPA: enterochelin esterase, partial [Candidatus Eisenbacteria bacterium]|nr:enterochelin esterase [Candidatus Eisenbacteria bacterium]